MHLKSLVGYLLKGNWISDGLYYGFTFQLSRVSEIDNSWLLETDHGTLTLSNPEIGILNDTIFIKKGKTWAITILDVIDPVTQQSIFSRFIN